MEDEKLTLYDPVYPRKGDIVRLQDGSYAIFIKMLGIFEIRKCGFLGCIVSAHGKEFIVNENEITLIDNKALKEIFIKEKIEP